MAKKFKIVQKLNLNGKPLSIAFVLYADTLAEITPTLQLLEGGYEVSEVIASDLTGSDTVVTNTNAHSQIGFVGSVNGYPIYESLKPYSGAIHFKNTVSSDDIAAVLRNLNPFPLHPTEKATKITFKGYETVAVASGN